MLSTLLSVLLLCLHRRTDKIILKNTMLKTNNQMFVLTSSNTQIQYCLKKTIQTLFSNEKIITLPQFMF